ncbi:MAG: TOBE domain-containing protein, partial [Limisphaerales bacterium]
HDQDEALTMSDRIAVMNRGKIEQLGTPEELYEKPRNRFVAEFLGSCNIVSGQVRSQSREGLVVEAALGQLSVAFSPGRDSFRLQGRGADLITLAIRPEKTILFSAAPRELPNCFPATVDDVIYSGAETHYHLRAAQQEIRNCLFNSVGHERFAAGQSVFVHFPAEALIPLDE